MLLLLPEFSTLHGPLELTPQLLPMQIASLPDHLSVLRGLCSGLEPRPFSVPQTSTGKLLRTF